MIVKKMPILQGFPTPDTVKFLSSAELKLSEFTPVFYDIETVKGKKYYFDSKGVLRTGWRKINKKYYFFRQYNTRAGYMVTSSKVNGIRIRKNGSAVYNKTQLAKLNLMVKASQTVDRGTNNRMTREQKLKACFRYIVSCNYGDGSDWTKWRDYHGLLHL